MSDVAPASGGSVNRELALAAFGRRLGGAAHTLLPGLSVSVVVALAAAFLAEQYAAPAMLFALLMGLALAFLHTESRCGPGIDVAATTVLRWGVALLGARIALDQILGLGAMTVLAVFGLVIATITGGVLLARTMGFDRNFGLLTGGAVAICGAAAAVAIAAVLPRSREMERTLVLTVFGVTTLSTLAMIVYPVIVQAIGLDAVTAGMFLGATIHDVAQVVGAGYSLSPETGDTATIVKLMRVAMLAPVVLTISLMMRAATPADPRKGVGVPWFLTVFLTLVAAQSVLPLPTAVTEFAGQVSRWFLLTAIAALGMRTSLRTLVTLGPRPLALMVAQTVLIAALMAVLMVVVL